MDKQQARDIVKETLEKSFDKGSFTYFIKNLLNNLDTSDKACFVNQGNYIPDAYKQYVNSLERIGKYASGDHKLDILIVKLKKETSIERARTMQRNFIARYLNGSRGGELKDAALVAFVSPDQEDWRFSLVKMDYRFEEGKKGKIKVKEEFTPARRWSFLVGLNENSHTAQTRLLPIMANDGHDPTLAELEEVFNIETVTKEFFEKYRELFLWAKEELDAVVEKDAKIKTDFTAKGVNTVDFAKKLLGQIVFLYFLQKKGWFGVAKNEAWGTGSKQFLRELFEKKHGEYKNFFNDILEPLFYEALRLDRSHEDHYYSRFNCKIPFLNGGLFDPMNNYDWVKTDILIANELFSNKHKTKEGDTGDGIIDVFDRYNFTVKEDEPLEKEVAIDPEMLGKVFENLLEVKDRKSKGTYYTPREIVHYMCRQSLISYLTQHFNGGAVIYEKAGEKQTDLVGNTGKKGQLDLTIEHTESPVILKDAIEKLIHMGERLGENEELALIKQQKINEGHQKTSDYKLQLPESIRKNAREIDEKLSNIKVCDPAIGSGAFPVGMMSEIVKVRNVLSNFVQGGNRTPYAFKRQCIEKCLYGVDIDPGAVEIAKLRLWLSLVVDEDDIKQIKPLPNLDYKIVCGDSLLGLPVNILPDDKITKELEEKKKQYFSTISPSEKNKIRAIINDLFSQLMENIKKYDPSISDVKFDFHTHFSEVFHEKNGFDVVIANPPYVRQESIKALKPDLAKAFAKFYCGTADLYTYFYKRGIDLLTNDGHLCFIAPNKFMRASYGKNTRRLLAKEVAPKQVIDFGDLPIFDATTYPSIILVQKCRARSPRRLSDCRSFGERFLQVATFTDISQIENPEQTIQAIGFRLSPDDLKEEGWTLERPEVLALMDKLRKAGKPLGEYVNDKFYRGVTTGLNEAFVITEEVKNSLISEDPSCEEIIKPWLRGKDIRKWMAERSNLYFLFIPWHFEIKKHPSVLQHLKRFKNKLENRNVEERDRYEWYALQRYAADYYQEFENTKIIYPDISQHPKFTWDESRSFLGNTGYIIPTSEKWLIGILNSKLLWWFYRNLSSSIRGGFVRYISQYMQQMPIATATEEQKDSILTVVQKILSAPDSSNVPMLEAEIDQMVYQLYNLTPEEIAIVEEKSSRQEK